MKRLKSNGFIEIFGVSFNGVLNLTEHARRRIFNKGV